MLIQDDDSIRRIGINWNKTVQVIEKTVLCLHSNIYAQPIKPYLRYGDMKNRIIAMPAYVGGAVNLAGIKWISSFPDNIKKGLPRAHSVIILNDPDTGAPIGVINTPLISVIRTASVSGLMIKHFCRSRELQDVHIGITGFGPIGQYHLQMCKHLFGDRIESVSIYDKRAIDPLLIGDDPKIGIVDSWEKAYTNSDIFITCTVSDTPYIDKKPKERSLHLNVSLRDYKPIVYQWFKDSIIVDNWEEVCREKTDIEMMHLKMKLKKEQTKSIVDVVVNDVINDFETDAPIMFNPMGMAVFDIAIGGLYFQAEKKEILHEMV
ncbi:MAG: 2,3-diaminopropionate biosynthesis protein SbnB [Fulvivirga sp.]